MTRSCMLLIRCAALFATCSVVAAAKAKDEKERCVACQYISTMMWDEIEADLAKGRKQKGKKTGDLQSLVGEALDSKKICEDRKASEWKEIGEKYEVDEDKLVLACEDLMPNLEDVLEDGLQDRDSSAGELRKKACTKKRGKSKPCKALWGPEETPDKLLTKRQKEAKANREEAAKFFEENKAKEGVVTTESGLQYLIEKKGGGKKKPKASDTVSVHYQGLLLNGNEFDSSYGRGEPATFGVGQVIPGWTEALQLMVRGDSWKLWIPSDIAYGERGGGDRIGPDAALHFQVELLGIEGVDEEPKGGECGRDNARDLFLPDSEGRPVCIDDPKAPKPDDWDEDEDGAWQQEMVRNPAYDGIWPPQWKEGAEGGGEL